MTVGFILFTLIIVTLLVLAGQFVRARSTRRRLASRRGTVVRDIPAGSYGQIRLEDSEPFILLAVRSATGEFLRAGTAVEIVDDSRSVILVRPLATTE